MATRDTAAGRHYAPNESLLGASHLHAHGSCAAEFAGWRWKGSWTKATRRETVARLVGYSFTIALALSSACAPEFGQVPVREDLVDTSWEEFRDQSTYTDQRGEAYYMVEWDLPVGSEAELRAY